MTMLKHCCTAALCTALLVPASWAQDKPSQSPATKPPAAKATAKPKATGTESKTPQAASKQGSAAEDDSPGSQAVGEIFACVAKGLPDGWQRAWVTVTELAGDGKERSFEGRFQVSLESEGDKRWDFVPCNARDVAERVYRLNDFLEPAKRQWKVATLLFMASGRFELKYDYTR